MSPTAARHRTLAPHIPTAEELADETPMTQPNRAADRRRRSSCRRSASGSPPRTGGIVHRHRGPGSGRSTRASSVRSSGLPAAASRPPSRWCPGWSGRRRPRWSTASRSAASRRASASSSRTTRSFRGRPCWTTSRPALGSGAPAGPQANRAARDWLRRVGLAGFEDRYPHQLSGGMRKRVALAQSLINEPRVLLMDEPFSALDVQTRSIMSDELLGLWEQTRPAVVFVTHDLEEAIALADKVVVLTAGPGRVKATFDVDLPRPRKAQEIRFTDGVRRAVLRDLGGAARPRSRPHTPGRPAAGRRDAADGQHASRRAGARPARPAAGAASRVAAAGLDLPGPAGPAGGAGRRLATRREHQAHRPVLLGIAQRRLRAAADLDHRRHLAGLARPARSWSRCRRRCTAS